MVSFDDNDGGMITGTGKTVADFVPNLPLLSGGFLHCGFLSCSLVPWLWLAMERFGLLKRCTPKRGIRSVIGPFIDTKYSVSRRILCVIAKAGREWYQ